jgi:hypothetical protein
VTATNRAATAKPGEWLLDPNDITITNTTDNNIIGSPNFIFSFAGNSVLTVATINSALAGGSNVSVRTSSNGVDGSGGNGDISFTNGTITTSFSGSAVSLKLLADRNIVLAAGTKIDLTGNTHDIVLASRANSGADGAVNISGTVQTAGGAITVGGGPAGTLSAIGNAASSNIGIQVQSTGMISSNGGAINMIANGANLAGGSFGLYLQGSILSGAGSINLTGTGVGLAGPSNVHGVLISGSTIAATGAGTITITGARGLGDSSNNIKVDGGSVISTVDGLLKLDGIPNTGGGSTSNMGVQLNLATVETTGAGSINITGIGSVGGANNYGVAVGLGGATVVRISGTGSGTISLNGLGGVGSNGISLNQGTVSTSNGSAVFSADSLNLASQVISVGGPSITFKTWQSPSTIGVNGGAGGLSLSNSFLNSVGTASQIIGDTSMTGTINVGTGYVISRAMAFKGGNNRINFAGAIDADVTATRSLQIDNTGTVSFGGAVGSLTPLASLIVNSGTSYLTGGVTTDFATNGSIFFSGRTILSSNSTLTTNNSRIVLGQVDGASAGSQNFTVNAGTGTVSFTSAVGSASSLGTLSSTGTGPLAVTGLVRTSNTQSYNGQLLSASSVSLSSSNAILNGGASITSDLTITGLANLRGTVQSGGTQSYGGAVTLGANTTISTSNANVFFAGLHGASIGGQSLTTSTGTGVLSLSSGVGTGTSLASFSASGAGGVSLAGGPAATTGTQSYAGPVLLVTTSSFTTGGPAITFGGSLGTNLPGRGAIITGTSNVSFVGVVGGGATPLASLTVSSTATTSLFGPVTASTQSYGGGIILINDATITTASGATFSGVNSAAGTARSLTVVSTVGGATANFGVFGIGGATALQTLSVTTNNAAVNFPGMTAANLTVSTAGGTIGQTGGFNISGTANFSTGAGLIDLGSLNSNDFATVLVNTTGSAGIRDGTAGMALGASQINGTLTLTGASGGTVTQSGALSTTNLVLLGTGANFVMTNGSNSLLNLAGNTGSINISHAAANSFNIANINSTNGVTTSGAFTFNNGTQLSNINSPISAGGAVTLTAGFFNGSGGITTPALTIATPAGVLTNVVVNGQTGAAAAALVTLLSGAVSINGVALTATVASTPSTPSVAPTPTVASVPTVASIPSTPTLASIASLPSIVSVASIAPSVPSVVSLPVITFVPPLIIAPIVTTPQFFVLPISDLPPISQLLPQIPAPNFNLALPAATADAPRTTNNAADRVALVTNTPAGALIPLGPRAVSETNAPLSSTATIKVDVLDTGGSNGQVVAFGIGVAPGRDGSTIIVPGLLSERGLGPVDNASSLTSLSQQVPTMNDEALMD